MNRNLNRRIHPIAEANGLSPKFHRKNREERYKEPQICRFYGSKKNHVSVFMPILEWTDEDVSEFIKERNIKCHPIYYSGGAI